MKVLVTGAAGFIGMHVAKRLLKKHIEVVGIDNINDYYDTRLKEDRIKQLNPQSGFRFIKLDIADRADMDKLFSGEKFDYVIHLAAQAGVRYSLENPHAYIDSNVTGFLNILEGCRHHPVRHLIYASSSSVYGANTHMPFSVNDNVDHPVSLYAATKKSNELMAHCYSHLYGVPATGLRFFTVYGPWGRPDMSPFLFVSAILENRPIKVFNHGKMKRDFTYIDDIVEGVIRVMDTIAQPDTTFDPGAPVPSSSDAPYRIYNIGNHTPVDLMTFIETIEKALNKKAVKDLLPMQPGDVMATFADIDSLRQATGFEPKTPLGEGIAQFVAWYRRYYDV